MAPRKRTGMFVPHLRLAGEGAENGLSSPFGAAYLPEEPMDIGLAIRTFRLAVEGGGARDCACMCENFQTFAEVRDYLYGLKSHGAKYGIDRMRVLVERLGHPERRYPVVHVAGTNGKGSTTAMLEAIFRGNGYRTGMFTSPHLVYQGERVQVNREILPHGAIVDYTNKLRPVAEALAAGDRDLHPSFFEFMTAMAFLRFAESSVDLAIIETGLGGRLDATNVVAPVLTVITSIGLDHTEILGGDLATIAGEKAGILKPGIPVVIGLLAPEAEAVVREKADALGCPVHSVREVFGSEFSAYPETSLAGDYQRINAATATLAARVLNDRFSISEQSISAGLQSVEWAGRWDRHSLVDREVILDATHNSEGAKHLESNLARLVAETGRKPTIVAGTLGYARALSLMPVLARWAGALHLVRPRQPRACSFEELERALPPDHGITVEHSSVEALFPAPGVCSIGGPGETIVVTGSIYLIGEVMDALYHEIPVAEGSLQD